jgi:hypothetical protein
MYIKEHLHYLTPRLWTCKLKKNGVHMLNPNPQIYHLKNYTLNFFPQTSNTSKATWIKISILSYLVYF